MKIYSISETCSCGAKFVYEDRVIESYQSNITGEHVRFLKAHENCRQKTVISDNKELKMFLVNKVPEPSVEYVRHG